MRKYYKVKSKEIDRNLLIDAYAINFEDVDDYIRKREFVASIVSSIYKKHRKKVFRNWKELEDGEAIQ